MILSRVGLTIVALLLANDNEYLATSYYEIYFTNNDGVSFQGLNIITTFDQDDNNEWEVIEFDSPGDLQLSRARTQNILNDLIELKKALTFRCYVNLILAGLFFVVSLGIIKESKENDITGEFFYTIFMIMVMSVASYSSFNSIKGFNDFIALVDKASKTTTYLKATLFSFVIDERFLITTVGVAVFLVIVKILKNG